MVKQILSPLSITTESSPLLLPPQLLLLTPPPLPLPLPHPLASDPIPSDNPDKAKFIHSSILQHERSTPNKLPTPFLSSQHYIKRKVSPMDNDII